MQIRWVINSFMKRKMFVLAFKCYIQVKKRRRGKDELIWKDRKYAIKYLNILKVQIEKYFNFLSGVHTCVMSILTGLHALGAYWQLVSISIGWKERKKMASLRR